MLFWIACTDKPGSNALRMKTRPDHLKWLETIKPNIVFCGALLGDDGETMIGSFFVSDLPDRAAAEAQAAGDPYSKAGLFESVAIRRFRKVIPQG